MGLFERLLEAHEQRRHERILTSVPRHSPPDVSVGIEGFLPPRVAAEVMGVSLEELRLLVEHGRLEAQDVSEHELWVRSAVVSVLGVREL